MATGGTGGHIFPAMAVAEEIRRRNPDVRLLFMGSLYGPEKQIAARAQIPFHGLPVRGLLGRGLRALPAIFRLTAAFLSSLGIVRKFRPDVIAGFGSYASFAPVLAGLFLRVPVLLHEQNAIAGTSNRYLAKLAESVCASLPSTQGFTRFVVTGNPVRKEIKEAAAIREGAIERNTRRILVMGGSQGAHALNNLMAKMLPMLKNAGIEIAHQCGEKDLAWLKECYVQNGFSPECVMPFMNNMGERYAWADIALCRSGASTVAELCASGTPAVFVPFPAAIHNHQMLNAQIAERSGAAIVIEEGDLKPEYMADLIVKNIEDKAKLKRMSKAALSLAKPDAAKLLVDELEKTARH